MAELQRVHLVCREVTDRAALPRKAQWYAGPTTTDADATVLKDLREPDPGESPDDAAHRLEAVVRRRALDRRYDDLVLVVGPAALRLLLGSLAGVSPGSVGSAALGPGAVTVVGLPRSARTIGVGPVLVGALVLAIVENTLWGRLGTPFFGTVAVMAVAAPLALVERTRPYAWALLKAAAIGVLILVLLLSSSGRFPAA